MPDYVVTGPDGNQYRVTAPEGATEQDVMARVRSQFEQQPKAEADPIRATVQKEFDAAKAAGLTSPSQRGLVQGLTFNFGDEILAGLHTPLEMIKRGTFSPAEGYKYAKAREDIETEDARKNGGIPATLAEIGGGVVSGGGIGQMVGRGMSAGAGLLRRAGAAAADGAILGAVAGAGEGNSIGERAGNAATGGILGGVVSGALPVAGAIGSRVLSPITSNIRALRDPQGYGNNQIARALTESGRSPDDIALALTQAANDGQPMFTVADAMGNAGQRMLATTARSPGIARTEVLQALDNRQAGQGRRIAGALAEGFDSPQTAEQTRTAMTAARRREADAAYGSVRQDAGLFDPSKVVAHLDQTIPPNPFGGPQPLADNSIEGALRGIRSRLTDGTSMLTDFRSALTLRRDIADAAQAAERGGQGNRAHALGNVVREMDTALENASSGFRQANRNFAQSSRDIEAIDAGRRAAKQGRPEDTIPAFNTLSDRGRAGYRAGYADPLIADAQGAAMGVNKARPLINDAFAAESNVMAPGAPMMQRRIGREDTMFQTRNAASGNSKTAENLNDDAAMGIDPSTIGQFATQIVSGNVGGALRTAMGALSNGWNGNTAAVREHVANILMQNAGTSNPRMLQAMLDETTRQIERVSQTARAFARGASGGLAVTPNAVGNRR